MVKSAAEQAHALAHSVGLRARDDLVLVRVRGEDRIAWLNGQITNDVRSAQPGSAVYALAVTVRGKIMADVWALDRGEELGILLPSSARAEVLESFERQIIMEDVELSAEPALRVLSLQGPRAQELASDLPWEHHRCDELGSGGLCVLVPTDDQDAWPRLSARVEQLGGMVVDEGGFELARLRAGRARFGKDFSVQNYPQEAGLKSLAVSFNKGCYLGQEVVCTLENRGKLTRALVRLAASTATDLASGAELQDAQGQVIGHVTSAVFDADLGHALALGYAKSAHTAPDTLLRSGTTELRVIAKAGAD